MMTYKGYIGKVEYDDENKVFTGEVINTRAVITFHGTSVKQLENEFHSSVDDYLDWCKADGIDPEKPYSGKVLLRLNPDLHRQAAIAAGIAGISLNAFIEKATKEAIASTMV